MRRRSQRSQTPPPRPRAWTWICRSARCACNRTTRPPRATCPPVRPLHLRALHLPPPRASKDNHTIRCPACVQPVRFPNPNLGAKSFPKNIDLLRLCSALNPTPEPQLEPGSELKPDKRPEADVEFVPRLWSEGLVRVWRNWILPSESVSLVGSSAGYYTAPLYGLCLLDLNTVLAKSKRLCKMMEDEEANSCKTLEFLSPEVFVALHEGNFSMDHHSDVWSLGCMLAMILASDAELTMELFEDCYCLHLKGNSGKFSDVCLSQYEIWREKVVSKLEALLMGTKFEPLLHALSACLLYRLECRPKVSDIWHCIRNHCIEVPADSIAASDLLEEKEYKKKLLSCLIIGNMGHLRKETGGVSKQQANGIISGNVSEVELAGSNVINVDSLLQKQVNGDFAKGQQGLHFHTLRGRNDCITGLAVGGGICLAPPLIKQSMCGPCRYTLEKDYSLASTMTGHNSIVSTLAVLVGVLYSGSWDGTIRLWLLSDHSLLSVLGDDTMGVVAPILSLSAEHHFLISAYENGSIKIWKNDALVKSLQIHEGAIFAVHMDGKWLFTGGWGKAINVQELLEDESQMIVRPIASITCDSVITSLSSWRGKLFVGLSNKEIKVYYYGTNNYGGPLSLSF